MASTRTRQTKPCKRCKKGWAQLDEKFCPRCHDIILNEMQLNYFTIGKLTPWQAELVLEFFLQNDNRQTTSPHRITKQSGASELSVKYQKRLWAITKL